MVSTGRTGKVTRAQMCKMICLLCNGGREPALDTTPSTSFIDIQGWATPYIAACYAQDIVSGVSEDRFHPDGHVTAAQAAKMLLVTLGYSTDYEGFTGAAWSTNVTILATQAKLFDGLNLSPTQVLTRDEAAQMIWNALNAYEVTYTTQTVTDANGQESIKVVREEKVIAGTTDKLTLSKTNIVLILRPRKRKHSRELSPLGNKIPNRPTQKARPVGDFSLTGWLNPFPSAPLPP